MSIKKVEKLMSKLNREAESAIANIPTEELIGMSLPKIRELILRNKYIKSMFTEQELLNLGIRKEKQEAFKRFFTDKAILESKSICTRYPIDLD